MGNPDPTIDQLWESLNASNIRLDKIWMGVKEVLCAKMPGMIERYNRENGRTGQNALQHPVGYYTGGVNLHEKLIPSVIVGSESEFSPLGPGTFSTNNSTCIWVPTRAKTTAALTRDASIMAHLAWGVMMGYQWGYRNSLNQQLWAGLGPSSVRATPKAEGSAYGGFYLSLDVVQSPDPSAASLYEMAGDVDEGVDEVENGTSPEESG